MTKATFKGKFIWVTVPESSQSRKLGTPIFEDLQETEKLEMGQGCELLSPPPVTGFLQQGKAITPTHKTSPSGAKYSNTGFLWGSLSFKPPQLGKVQSSNKWCYNSWCSETNRMLQNQQCNAHPSTRADFTWQTVVRALLRTRFPWALARRSLSWLLSPSAVLAAVLFFINGATEQQKFFPSAVNRHELLIQANLC